MAPKTKAIGPPEGELAAKAGRIECAGIRLKNASWLRRLDRADRLKAEECELAPQAGSIEVARIPADRQPAEAGELAPEAGGIEVAGILVDRLKAETQRLVAQADIETATVGQIRGQLEVCLGLGPGALRESKRRKRLTCRVLQAEVIKNSQMSPDCKRIVRALASCDAYPDHCRQMLAEGLPSALSRNSGGELHPHQILLLEMARDAITEARLQTMQEQDNCRLRKASEEGILQTRRMSRDAAAKNRAEASGIVDGLTDRLRDAESLAKDAEDKVAEVKRMAKGAHKLQLALEASLAEAAQVSTGPLQLLVSGGWKSTGSRDMALSAVEKALSDKSTELSLASALPEALKCLPVDRSSFANTVVEAVQAALSEKVSTLQLQLQESKDAQNEARVLQVEASHDASLDRAAHAMIALADARERHESLAAVCNVQDAELEEQAALVDKCAAEQAGVEKVLDEFNSVLQVIEQMMADTCQARRASKFCIRFAKRLGSNFNV